jgi:osmotically-inducible protein OsmY
MKTKNMCYAGLFSALLVATAMLTGCSESPQDQYKDATQNLKQAKQARQDAQQTLQDKQQALADAKKDVKQAKSDLQSAKQKVAQAMQKVDKLVDDKILFRTIQRKLVNNKNFGNSAISVSVNQRVVTLTGTVPDQSTHKKALQTTRSQPGVKKVIDSLKVNDQSENKNDNGQRGHDHGDSGDNAD